MAKFYSILLDDKAHSELKRISYEKGEHISDLVRKGIRIVLAGGCDCKKAGVGNASN